MAMFNSYVKLQEGNPHKIPIVWKIKDPIKMAINVCGINLPRWEKPYTKNTANLTGKSTIASPKD